MKGISSPCIPVSAAKFHICVVPAAVNYVDAETDCKWIHILWEQLTVITNLQSYRVAHMYLVVSNTKQEKTEVKNTKTDLSAHTDQTEKCYLLASLIIVYKTTPKETNIHSQL